MTKFIAPGSCVGIIGGGLTAFQLARAASALGMKTVVLAGSTDDIALKAADLRIIGSAGDAQVITELQKHVDVVTYADESVVNADLLDRIMRPEQLPSGTEILNFTQDRYLEKVFLEDLHLNVLPYNQVVTADDIQKATADLGYPAVLKLMQKGGVKDRQLRLDNDPDAWRARGLMAQRPMIMEAWLTNPRRLATVCIKSDSGLQVLPLVEITTSHAGGDAVIEPAQVDGAVLIESLRIAEQIGNKVAYQGIFSVEFFLTPEGALYVEKVAPGPRMYGDVMAAVASDDQYALHMRAILGWPVPTVPIDGSAVLIPLLPAMQPAVATQIQIKPQWRWHFFPHGSPLLGELCVPGPLIEALATLDVTAEFAVDATTFER